MSKICPQCNIVYDDSHAFCPNCGSRLVDKQEDFASGLSIGDANAIMGGVHIDKSQNISSHDTHYHSTIVNERQKSEAEIQLDAANQLRSKTRNIIEEHGRTDSPAPAMLACKARTKN